MSEASKAVVGKGVWALVAVVVIAGAVWIGNSSDRAGEDAAGTLAPAERVMTKTVQPTDATEAGEAGLSAEVLAEPAPGDVDADRSKTDKAGGAGDHVFDGFPAELPTFPA